MRLDEDRKKAEAAARQQVKQASDDRKMAAAASFEKRAKNGDKDRNKAAAEVTKRAKKADKDRKKSDERARKVSEAAEKAAKRSRERAEKFKHDRTSSLALAGAAAKKVPVAGGKRDGPLKDVFDDLSTLIRLVRAYMSGDYREVPWETVAYAMGALLYLVNPLDLIPDAIPGVGLVDDAAVIAFVVKSVMDDLEDFRRWERVQNKAA
jgi:uncharacterized membrane protein YkvA (DUF1232 family)